MVGPYQDAITFYFGRIANMHRGLCYQYLRGSHWRKVSGCILLRDGTLRCFPGFSRLVCEYTNAFAEHSLRSCFGLGLEITSPGSTSAELAWRFNLVSEIFQQ